MSAENEQERALELDEHFDAAARREARERAADERRDELVGVLIDIARTPLMGDWL